MHTGKDKFPYNRQMVLMPRTD